MGWFRLLRRSALGLMDATLPAADVETIESVLQPHQAQGISFHAVRTRTAAARGFVSMHVLVPGDWSVRHAHEVAERIEAEIRAKLPQVAIFTHVEPLGDPLSFKDKEIEHE